MHSIEETGAVRATRFLILLSVAALCGLLFSGVAGAQLPPPPSDQPTVTLGNVTMSGTVCPDSATMTIEYSAEAPLGLKQIQVTAIDELLADAPALLDVVSFDSPTQTYAGKTIFTIPADTPTSTWRVEVVVDAVNEMSATEMTTVEVVADADCEPPSGQLTFSIDDIDVSGPVCPDTATVSVSYTVTMPGGVGTIDLLITDELGYTPEPYTTVVDQGPNATVSETHTFEIPPTATTTEWLAILAVSAEGEEGVIGRDFAIEIDPGCENDRPRIEITSAEVSGPLCPSGALVKVQAVVDNVQGPIEIEAFAIEPSGDQYVSDVEVLILDGAPQDVTLLIDVPPTAEPGTWVVQVVGTVIIEGDILYDIGEHQTLEIEGGTCETASNPKVVINDIQVCPSKGTVTATVTASDPDGLDTMSVMSELLQEPQVAYLKNAETQASRSFEILLALPAGGAQTTQTTFELRAEATDLNGNTGVAHETFGLGIQDDCRPIPTPTATPNPDGGHKGGDDGDKNDGYWDYDDKLGPNSFTNVPTAPDYLKLEPGDDYKKVIITDDDSKVVYKKDPSDDKLAFTGAETELATAIGGVLIAAGLALAYGRRERG